MATDLMAENRRLVDEYNKLGQEFGEVLGHARAAAVNTKLLIALVLQLESAGETVIADEYIKDAIATEWTITRGPGENEGDVVLIVARLKRDGEDVVSDAPDAKPEDGELWGEVEGGLAEDAQSEG
jgi:hypothetical protein